MGVAFVYLGNANHKQPIKGLLTLADEVNVVLLEDKVTAALKLMEELMAAFVSELVGHFHRPRPKLLTPFGWFAVLAIIAVTLGTALRFAT
jgi:hypothetical protein